MNITTGSTLKKNKGLKVKIKGIVIHCSDSEFGSRALIDEWHRKRGWDEIGYSYVICNGNLSKNCYDEIFDGLVEIGRSLDKDQAHCRGYNHTHIGICLIGKKNFTTSQFYSLLKLLEFLKKKYNISNENVLGHCDTKYTTKTCPNFSVTNVLKNMFTL